jgi:hypothetical protein
LHISKTTTIPWLRVLAEGAVIVLSILLAFGIDAWWEGRAELGQTREHLAAVRLELFENARLLDEQAVSCERSRAANEGLFSLMGPNPEPVPPDSLVSLVAEALFPGVGNRLSTTAIDAMIAEGQFAAIQSADLRLGLGDWLSSEVNQRSQQRDNTRAQLRETQAYVETIMPYGLVRARWSSLSDLPESRFRLDVDRVLGDATLEGSLSQLALWRQSICNSDSRRQEKLKTLLVLLDAELAE